MRRIQILMAAAAAVALGSVACSASATTVSWADLTSSNADGSSVAGSIATGSGTVGVQLDSSTPTEFVNINNTGTNYWTGAYSYNGSFNQPATSDIVALSDANTETITFSQPVTDLYLALNSWNGADVTFNHAFTVASEGCGFWGCGSFAPNVDNTGFTGVNEAVGILEIPGTISSLTITDTTSEDWHGLTVGIGSIAVSAAPEPATWALMFVGIGLLGAALRRTSQTGRTFKQSALAEIA